LNFCGWVRFILGGTGSLLQADCTYGMTRGHQRFRGINRMSAGKTVSYVDPRGTLNRKKTKGGDRWQVLSKKKEGRYFIPPWVEVTMDRGTAWEGPGGIGRDTVGKGILAESWGNNFQAVR